MTIESATRVQSLSARSAEFIDSVEKWVDGRPAVELERLLALREKAATEVAVISVDVIEGFCRQGPLASPRVASIIDPITRLFTRAHEAGVPHFVLTQDTHTSDAEEFSEFPPHCIAGTAESATVGEFKVLSFFNGFDVIPKNSINSLIDTELAEWLAAHPQVTEFIAVGDCTDLCLYQLAMSLKLRSNASGLGCRVTVPIDCVDTYHLGVKEAASIGAMPHDGDLLHYVFLHHMALNGVNVVAGIR